MHGLTESNGPVLVNAFMCFLPHLISGCILSIWCHMSGVRSYHCDQSVTNLLWKQILHERDLKALWKNLNIRWTFFLKYFLHSLLSFWVCLLYASYATNIFVGGINFFLIRFGRKYCTIVLIALQKDLNIRWTECLKYVLHSLTFLSMGMPLSGLYSIHCTNDVGACLYCSLITYDGYHVREMKLMAS